MLVDIRTILKQVAAAYSVDIAVIAYPYHQIAESEYYRLRSQLNAEKDWKRQSQNLLRSIAADTIYVIEDYLGISFVSFVIPGTKDVMLIGPFKTQVMNHGVVDRLHLDADQTHHLKERLATIPLVEKQWVQLHLLPVISVVFQKDKLRIRDMIEEVPSVFMLDKSLFKAEQTGLEEKKRILLQRYRAENEVLAAVSEGNAQKAHESLVKMGGKDMADRFFGSLRTQKNSLIIFNSLMRKSIEKAGVHPYYIDEISTRFSHMIEMIMDDQEYYLMMKMLVSEYCGYVNKYGNNQYSALTKNIVNYVNYDLSKTYSLSDIAKAVNLNPSYVSNLFKKETGMTLTNYIQYQKMRYASQLLKTTQKSVAQIAESVGMMDVNYFSRVFKKHMGVSPTEFRNH